MTYCNAMLIGACGRMGKRIYSLLKEDSKLRVSSAVESPKSSLIGKDYGEICGEGKNSIIISSFKDEVKVNPDIIIDFSSLDVSQKGLCLFALRGSY